MTKVVGEVDKWQIILGPTLREYFKVPTSTSIFRLAVVFRTANGSSATLPPTLPTGQSSLNNDLFIDLSQTTPTCAGSVTKAGSTLTITGCQNLKNSTQYFIKFDPSALLTSEG